jgi:hypothetical protein
MGRVRDLVPTSNGARWRAPSRQTLACVTACVLIVVVAAIDYGHAESRLPDVSPRDCDPTNLDCFTANRQEQLVRDREAEPLEDQYSSRAWLYAFAILTVSAIGAANSLRTRPRTEWPGVFSNLGVIGVWVGIAAIALILIASEASINVRAGPALTIPVALLGAAAIGTIIGRSEGWGEESAVDGVKGQAKNLGKLAIHIGTGGAAKRSRLEQLAGWFSTGALVLTALTVLLAVAFIVPQPECGGASESPAAWTSPIDSVAAVTGIGAIAAGVAALILRRWIAALVSLVVNPVALLLILASTCAFY